MSVYLDDLPSARTEDVTVDSKENAPTRNKKDDNIAKKANSNNDDSSNDGKSLKRQLSIADMFSKVPRDNAKRLKTNGTGDSSTVMQRAVSLGGIPALNSIPLNLDAFRASLKPEDLTLLNLELETIGKSWLKVLTEEIKKPYFLNLKRFLASEGLENLGGIASASKIYPQAKDVYTWSQTPLGRIRVVIIGQDPYHAPGQAHGLCFSVPKGVQPPPSLKNIYAELKTEYPEFEPPNHGNLSSWASNGVLLLNTCLTVRAHAPGSHSNKGWEQFTDRVVDVIDRYGGANLGRGDECTESQRLGVSRGVVFLAWGSWAQKRVARLDKKKHLILTSAHPSPLSAYKGFFGNNHFREANLWLDRKYGPDGKVEWCKLE